MSRRDVLPAAWPSVGVMYEPIRTERLIDGEKLPEVARGPTDTSKQGGHDPYQRWPPPALAAE